MSTKPSTLELIKKAQELVNPVPKVWSEVEPGKVRPVVDGAGIVSEWKRVGPSLGLSIMPSGYVIRETEKGALILCRSYFVTGGEGSDYSQPAEWALEKDRLGLSEMAALSQGLVYFVRDLFQIPTPEPLVVEEAPKKAPRKQCRHVGQLGLSEKATTALEKAGFGFLEDLLTLNVKQVEELKGVGSVSLVEILKALEREGLALAESAPGPSFKDVAQALDPKGEAFNPPTNSLGASSEPVASAQKEALRETVSDQHADVKGPTPETVSGSGFDGLGPEAKASSSMSPGGEGSPTPSPSPSPPGSPNSQQGSPQGEGSESSSPGALPVDFKAKNERRLDLCGKSIAGTLTEAEAEELDGLEAFVDEAVKKVAPLDFAGLDKLKAAVAEKCQRCGDTEHLLEDEGVILCETCHEATQGGPPCSLCKRPLAEAGPLVSDLKDGGKSCTRCWDRLDEEAKSRLRKPSPISPPGGRKRKSQAPIKCPECGVERGGKAALQSHMRAHARAKADAPEVKA